MKVMFEKYAVVASELHKIRKSTEYSKRRICAAPLSAIAESSSDRTEIEEKLDEADPSKTNIEKESSGEDYESQFALQRGELDALNDSGILDSSSIFDSEELVDEETALSESKEELEVDTVLEQISNFLCLTSSPPTSPQNVPSVDTLP